MGSNPREAVPAKQALQELQDAGLSEVPDLSQLSKVVPWSIDGWMDGWIDDLFGYGSIHR